MIAPAPIQPTAKRFKQDVSFGVEERGLVWREHSVVGVFLLFRFGGIKMPFSKRKGEVKAIGFRILLNETAPKSGR